MNVLLLLALADEVVVRSGNVDVEVADLVSQQNPTAHRMVFVAEA